MDDLTICGFCKCQLEDDESLEPIYIGDTGEVRPFQLETFEDMKHTDRSHKSAQGRALIESLHEHPEARLRLHEHVETVERMGRNGLGKFESTRHDDKVAVSLLIKPETRKPEPAMKVCGTCAEKFRSID